MIPNRRNLLKLALSGSGLGAAASATLVFRDQPSYRRAGVAFDTGVALTVVGLTSATPIWRWTLALRRFVGLSRLPA